MLLLWTIASGAVAVSASGNEANIKKLGELASGGVGGKLPGLTKEEVDEISEVGKKIHFRHYVSLIQCLSYVL